MHKLFATIGAIAMAVTLQFSAATPTRANPAVIAAAIGFGLLGLGVGAAVAGSYNNNRATGYYGGTGLYGGTDYYGGTGYYGGRGLFGNRGYYGGTGYSGGVPYTGGVGNVGNTGYYGATGYSGGNGGQPVYVTSDHVQACAQAYRSYSPVSDTYLGFDGVRHQCRR
ncbi:MAG TPA: BA14K family protein [Devosiaceae bacterium]|nr:BA14K family protein [Devosiaceae bacterium]